MAVLDWVFLAVLVASLLVGAWRGLVYEVFSVVSWIAAFVLAQWLAPATGHALRDHLYVVDPMGNWMMRFPAVNLDAQVDTASAAKPDSVAIRACSSS